MTGSPRWILAAPVLLSLSMFAACGARSVSGGPDVDAATVPRDAAVLRDTGPLRDVTVPPDVGLAPDPCECPAGEVWRFHHCLPALSVGCGPACGPNGATCATNWTCDSCGAASSCATFDCQPTCVYDPASYPPGPMPEYLRIGPTWGPPGSDQVIAVEGWPFYIGALFYLATLGDEPVDEDDASRPCTLGLRIPAGQSGTWPIWVSQYGGGGPWVLAGFYTRANAPPPSCVQPGLPCGGATPCCATTDVPMSCQQGRCRQN